MDKLEFRTYEDFRVSRYLGERGVLLLEGLVNITGLPPFSKGFLQAFRFKAWKALLAGPFSGPCPD